MKINLSLLLIFIAVINTYSQLNPNSKFIDATISYNTSMQKQDFAVANFIPQDYSRHFLRSEFSYGWAFQPNQIFSIGITFDSEGYSYEYYDNFNERFISYSEKEKIYSFNASYERLFNLNDKILFSPQIKGSFGLGKKKYDENSESLENNLIGYSISIAPGLQYFLSEKWVLTGSFGRIEYTSKTEKLDIDIDDVPKNKDKSIGAFFGLNTFGLGIRYYLNNSVE